MFCADTGKPVEALLIPLKGIVGPDSKLLASIVASVDILEDQGLPPYATFKSPIVATVS